MTPSGRDKLFMELLINIVPKTGHEYNCTKKSNILLIVKWFRLDLQVYVNPSEAAITRCSSSSLIANPAPVKIVVSACSLSGNIIISISAFEVSPIHTFFSSFDLIFRGNCFIEHSIVNQMWSELQSANTVGSLLYDADVTLSTFYQNRSPNALPYDVPCQ